MKFALSVALGLLPAVVVLLSATARAQLPVVPPERLGLRSEQLARIDAFVERAIGEQQMPGCVVAIGRTGGVGLLKAYGQRQVEPTPEPMTVDTVFDLASLTKPIATATSIMILVERGEVRLRSAVADVVPEFAANGKERITIEQLLTHHSGLIPDNPLSDYEDGPQHAWERTLALKSEHEPGTSFVYSDVNFLVLGEVIRRASGQDVAEFSAKNIFQPLGMTETTFQPGADLATRAAPTERRDGRWLRGEVHDPRSALLGGIAGHAGLFSTASDLAVYCDALLRGSRPGAAPPRIISPATLAEMIRARTPGGQRRGLGWDIQSGYSSNRGELFSDAAFGHGGFTGTALWIDPQLDLFVVFLSNRLHPDGTGAVNDLAGRIGTIAAGAIDGPNEADQIEAASR